MANVVSDLTGGLFGDTGPNYAKSATRAEAKRKGLINLGLNQINSIFAGGTSPFYTQATGRFNPRSTYYNINNRGQFTPFWAPVGAAPPAGPYNPTLLGRALGTGGGDLLASLSFNKVVRPLADKLGFGGLFGSQDSPRDIALKAFNRGALFNAPTYQTFEGFTPEFYQERAKAYENYALPQLGEQYRQNQNALLYGLENRGLLHESSVADAARRDLERTVGRGKQQIAETGISQANEVKQAVENSRQQAIQQLYQSADPAQAFQSAIANAASLRTPSAFAPISDMFGNIARTYYLNQILNNYRTPTYLAGGVPNLPLAPV